MSNEQLFFSWANAVAVEPRRIMASSEIMAVNFMMYFTRVSEMSLDFSL